MALKINIGPHLVSQLGAYIQTDLSAVVSINGVASGVVALVGMSERGTTEAAEFTDFGTLAVTYGSGPLVDAAKAAFLGGAGKVVCVRAGGPKSAALTHRLLEERVAGAPALAALNLPFVAPEAGSGYNNVLMSVVRLEGSVNTIVPGPELPVVPADKLDAGVQNPAPLVTRGDRYVVTVTHKRKGGVDDQDTFTIPTFFARRTVLLRRGERLMFAPEWVETHSHYSNPALKMLSDVERGPQGNVLAGHGALSPLDDIAAQLQDFVQSSDVMQVFEPGEPVPVGLMLYEMQVGNLFGNSACRFLRLPVEEGGSLFDLQNWFGQEGGLQPFFGEFDGPDGETVTTRHVYLNRAPIDAQGTTLQLPGFTLIDAQTAPLPVLTQVTLFVEGAPAQTEASFAALSLHNEVMKSKLSGDVAGLLALDTYAKAVGGSNGDDGTGWYTRMAGVPGFTDTWTAALKKLEGEEVNYVVPAYRFQRDTSFAERVELMAAISGVLRAHVDTMSNLVQRQRRVLILGFPAARPNERVDQDKFVATLTRVAPGLLGDTDRVQLYVDPFTTAVIDGQRTAYGAEMVAPYMAGRHANLQPWRSVTFSPVGSMFEEGTRYDWTYVNKDRLIGLRVAFLERFQTSGGAKGLRVHHNPTTYQGPANRGYQEFVLRRIDDHVSMFVLRNLEQTFVGTESRGRATEKEMKRFTERLLGRLTGGPIVAYRDVVVTANEDLTVYSVTFKVQPVTEVKFIPITMAVTFDLA